MSELAQRPLPTFHEDPAVAARHDREVAHGDASDASSAGNFFKYPGNTLKALDSYVKGLAAPSETMKDGGKAAGMMGNGLSMGAGVLKTMKGLAEVTQADTRDKGVADLIGGVSGVGSGLLGMLKPADGGVGDLAKKTVSPLLSMLTGGMQVAGGAADFGRNGITVDNFVDMLSGVFGLGSGVASAVSGGAGISALAAKGTGDAAALLAAETMGASAATAGAAFTGAPVALAAGAAAGNYINDLAERTSRGNFGRDEHGRERTAQGEAVDFGLSEEEKYRRAGFGETSAHVLGATASMGKGVANIGINAARQLFGYLTE